MNKLRCHVCSAMSCVREALARSNSNLCKGLASSSWQRFMARSDYVRVCCRLVENHTTLLRHSRPNKCRLNMFSWVKTNSDQRQQMPTGWDSVNLQRKFVLVACRSTSEVSQAHVALCCGNIYPLLFFNLKKACPDAEAIKL
ncbi:hypothetical protein DPX16_4861 [Anabarilius grahami]|uniref:Uncharacterized protein n=1 Tax=Anabarilius grahami TaxID=495550 RepID=A0A3N0Y187_ANAGA|nr:hypothetical protein DPX16_4861 [Anabarilius grahami]